MLSPEGGDEGRIILVKFWGKSPNLTLTNQVASHLLASLRDKECIYFERSNNTLLSSDGVQEEEPFITLFPSLGNKETFFIFFCLGFSQPQS